MNTPSRRSVLQLGAATVGIGSLGSSLLAARTSRGVELKKAVKIGMVKVEGSLEDKFKLLLDLGFQGVELDSPSDLNPEEVLEAKAATGIEIPGVVCSTHWGKPLSHPDRSVREAGRQGLETAIRQCAQFGGSSVLLVPGIVNAEVSYEMCYARSQAEIRKVLPLCDELNVDIAFENVWNNFLLSPLEAARYSDEFESPRVGWHFDVGNIVKYGWPEQWIRTLGHRVMKLDIKEYSRKKLNEEGQWAGFGVKIGDGDCNWPAVMKALDEIGYSGWATAEVGGGDADRLAEISGRMDRAFAS